MRIFSTCEKDNSENHPFDPRDPFVGSYNCSVHKVWVEQDSNLEWSYHNLTYSNTLLVEKHIDSAMLQISGLPVSGFREVMLDLLDSSFGGYHIYGRFKHDSIFCHFYLTPSGMYNWDYRGKKMK